MRAPQVSCPISSLHLVYSRDGISIVELKIGDPEEVAMTRTLGVNSLVTVLPNAPGTIAFDMKHSVCLGPYIDRHP